MAETQQGTGQQTKADDKDKVVRSHVLLRNGTTVAIDDYDEKVHGKKVEETDDQYNARLAARPSGIAPGMMHPRTTLANLHTYDSTQVPAAVAVVPAPLPAVSPLATGMPVATTEEPNTNLLDPTKTVAGQPGVMAAPQVQAPLTDEQKRAQADQKKNESTAGQVKK